MCVEHEIYFSVEISVHISNEDFGDGVLLISLVVIFAISLSLSQEGEITGVDHHAWPIETIYRQNQVS